jgi:hypothetical protein
MAATPASSKPRARSTAALSRRLGPALHRDLAALGVDADGDAAGKAPAGRLATSSGSRSASGAEDHAAFDAAREPGLDRSPCRGCRRRAAPGILMAARIASTAGAVDRLAGEGAVEIDDVQPAEALRGESARLGGRVVVEDGGGSPCRPRSEAHALAAFEIDGGKQDHGRHFRKLAIKRQTKRLALLGMELAADDVVAADDRGDGAAIIGGGDELLTGRVGAR